MYRAGYTWDSPDDIWALSVTGTGIAFQATDLSSMPPFAPHAIGWFAAYGRSDGVTSVVYTGLFDKKIHAMNFSTGASWWTETPGANAPAAAGNPTAYLRSDGYNAVVYRTADDHIGELTFKPGLPWQWCDSRGGSKGRKAGMVTLSALTGVGRLWLWTGCSAAVAACAPDGYGMQLNPETNSPSGTYTGGRPIPGAYHFSLAYNYVG